MDDLRSEIWRTYTLSIKNRNHPALRNDGYTTRTHTHTPAIFRATWSWDPDNLPALTWQQRLRWFYWRQKNQHFWHKNQHVWQNNQQLHQFFNKQNQTLHICINICILYNLYTHLFRKGTDTTSLSLAVMNGVACRVGTVAVFLLEKGSRWFAPRLVFHCFSWFFVMWCHQAPL